MPGATGMLLSLQEVGGGSQCGAKRKIEGNNRMGKTRDLFKKIRDAKGVFHAKK